MQKHTILLSLLFPSLLLFVFDSCKKPKKNTAPPTLIDSVLPAPEYNNYTHLKPGNYWIYRSYKLDSVSGAAHAENTYDSIYVEKDTVLNGYTYHKYVSPQPFSGTLYNVTYLRDSLSYTVTNTGKIVFSSEDTTTVFSTFSYGPNAATAFTVNVTEQMGLKGQRITVDAGTFTTISYRQIYNWPTGYKYGPAREYAHRYAIGVGLISETTAFYEGDPAIWERRLVRYHIN